MLRKRVLDNWVDLKILIDLLTKDNKKLEKSDKELFNFRLRIIGEVIGDPKKHHSVSDELIFKALRTYAKGGGTIEEVD